MTGVEVNRNAGLLEVIAKPRCRFVSVRLNRTSMRCDREDAALVGRACDRFCTVPLLTGRVDRE